MGLAIADRPHRKLHLGFLAVVLALEALSVAWTRHVNGPFVNAGAESSSSYYVNLTPGSIAATYWFYLAHLFSPALAVLVVWPIAAAWRDRRRFWLALSLAAAGFASLVPHSLLPNHRIEEYAWAAAPWLFAPLFALVESTRRRLAPLAASLLWPLPRPWAMSPAMTPTRFCVGWWAKTRCRAPWPIRFPPMRPSTARRASWWQASAIRRCPGRITTSSVSVRRRASLDRALPPSAELHRSSRLVAFAVPASIDLKNFDYLARYRSSGRLVGIGAVSDIPPGASLPELLVPDLEVRESELRRNPEDAYATSIAPRWRSTGACGRKRSGGWIRRRLAARARTPPSGGFPPRSAIAPPKRRRNRSPDCPPRAYRSAQWRGAGSTDLYWTVPEGMAFEIHVSAPNGPLFSSGNKSGHARAEGWVTNGMQFFLQDVSGGKPLYAKHTLASVKVEVTR